MKREMRWSFNLGILFVMLAVSLTGCGGSGGSSDGTASSEDTDFLVFANQQAASVVVGQDDFVNNVSGTTATTFSGMYGNPVVHNGVLYLPDYGNARVLGYNAIPTVNGASADFVLGQADFTSNVEEASQSGMSAPQGLSVDDDKLFLTDYDNHRIAIYNTVPTSGPGSADVVVGQADFISAGYATSQSGLFYPEAAYAVAGKLIVTDTVNNRVLIWNTIPAVSGALADIVLGQNDFTSNKPNDDDQDGGEDTDPTARTLSTPAGVWSDGTRLVVLDSDNNRALIWNSFPTANFQPADLVLGQQDFTHNAADDQDNDGVSDGPSASTMDFPYDGVFCKNDQLFIADSDNHRVLIWNTFPTSNFAPADVVLGQFDFSGDEANDADGDGSADDDPSATTLFYPNGIFVEGSKLIVSDNDNYRYLIYEGQ